MSSVEPGSLGVIQFAYCATSQAITSNVKVRRDNNPHLNLDKPDLVAQWTSIQYENTSNRPGEAKGRQ